MKKMLEVIDKHTYPDFFSHMPMYAHEECVKDMLINSMQLHGVVVVSNMLAQSVPDYKMCCICCREEYEVKE